MICFPLDNTEYEANALGAWCSNRTRGVFSDEGHYTVTANGDMSITVNPGLAWLKADTYWGIYAYETNPKILTIETADGALTRIDAICIRLDKNRNVGELVIKKGSYATQSPEIIPPARNLDYDEIYVATVIVRAGAVEIRQNDITDQRLNESYCGIMRDGVNGIPTQALYDTWLSWFNEFKDTTQDYLVTEQANFKTWIDSFKSASQDYMDTAETDFNAWFESIKGHLSEDVAGNLLNLINTKLDKNLFNQPNGVAGLDANGKLKQMPTVEDVGATPASHETDKLTASPVHGIKWLNNRLQFFDGTTWTYIEIGGNAGLPPENITGIAINSGNGCLKLTWHDSTNPNWDGTKLVRKVGSYPNSITDGILILDNKVKDTYATTPFIDSNLTNGTTYYYQFFPYSDNNVYNESADNRRTGTPAAFKVYGVQIDLNNGNPETSVTYTDDAIGMTPGSADWDTFFGHKPCLFKNGAVVGYLNPMNFAQFEDGSAADITSGNAGDVMIEFPRRGLTINTVDNKVMVKMTDDLNNPDFGYLAHTRGSTRKERFYLGAYKGYTPSSKLRSLSGRKPTINQTIEKFRTQAQANGLGYEQSGFYQLTFRQAMYVLKYKNLNSQIAIGRGYVDYNTSSIATGGTNERGMDFGETTGKLQMKLFGLEDFWGNIFEYVDGFVTTSTRNILTTTTNFNDSGSGYIDQGRWGTSNLLGYMCKPQGTTETGFVIKEGGGSSTTYFCDESFLHPTGVAVCGGYEDVDPDLKVGIFHFLTGQDPTDNPNTVGARLMYL